MCEKEANRTIVKRPMRSEVSPKSANIGWIQRAKEKAPLPKKRRLTRRFQYYLEADVEGYAYRARCANLDVRNAARAGLAIEA